MGWVLILTVVVALDCMLSGYRAVQGRTGRLPSWRRDGLAQLSGLALGAVLLAVPVLVGVATTSAAQREEIARAGAVWSAWLSLPTVLALLSLLTLSWRWRYLATALVLGPMTWLRPVAAVMAGIAGAEAAQGWLPRAAVLIAVVVVLAVEPIVGAVACRTAVRASDDEESTV